jgi:hypothetical protein
MEPSSEQARRSTQAAADVQHSRRNTNTQQSGNGDHRSVAAEVVLIRDSPVRVDGEIQLVERVTRESRVGQSRENRSGAEGM